MFVIDLAGPLTSHVAYPAQTYPQMHGASAAYVQAPYGGYTVDSSGQQSASYYGTTPAYSYGTSQSQPVGYNQSATGQTSANVERLSDGRVWLRGSEGEQEALDPRKIDVEFPDVC